MLGHQRAGHHQSPLGGRRRTTRIITWTPPKHHRGPSRGRRRRRRITTGAEGGHRDTTDTTGTLPGPTRGRRRRTRIATRAPPGHHKDTTRALLGTGRGPKKEDGEHNRDTIETPPGFHPGLHRGPWGRMKRTWIPAGTPPWPIKGRRRRTWTSTGTPPEHQRGPRGGGRRRRITPGTPSGYHPQPMSGTGGGQGSRAHLRMHVTHDTNTERDFPIWWTHSGRAPIRTASDRPQRALLTRARL